MQTLLDLLPTIILCILGGYFFYLLSKTKQIEPSDIATAIKAAAPLAAQIEPAARIAVMAAEEYARTGKLSTSDEKLAFAIHTFKSLVPNELGVTEDQMLKAIHSFIPLANSLGVKVEIINEPKTVPPVQG